MVSLLAIIIIFSIEMDQKLLLLIELFINEFTLAQLAYDKQLGIDNIH